MPGFEPISLSVETERQDMLGLALVAGLAPRYLSAALAENL